MPRIILIFVLIFLNTAFFLYCGSENEDASESSSGSGGNDSEITGSADIPSWPTKEIPSETPDDMIQSGVLTAGDIDDNLNFTAFKSYLNGMLKSDQSGSFANFHVKDRIIIRITDRNKKGVSNAQVSITPLETSSPSLQTFTNSGGVFYFFPTLDQMGDFSQVKIIVSPVQTEFTTVETTWQLSEASNNRIVNIELADYDSTLPASLDLAFVIDATGSMADELNYLKREFEAIVTTIQSEYSTIAMKFGLVVYRDTGDLYVTRSFDFTDSVDTMKKQLADQRANGGGDYPEAMDQALSAALNLNWRQQNTVKLLFLVADAPPHENKFSNTLAAARSARNRGINIHPLAASGVGDTAELLMRIMAVTTHGRYLFLTDDSGVGNPHAEPKIPCYVVTRLDQLIVRVISGALEGKRIEPASDQVIREVGNYSEGICATIEEN